MLRRQFLQRFLQGAGCFAVSAALPFRSRLWAAPSAQPRKFHFPQGIASGDPSPSSVMLWTRVEALTGAIDPVALVVQIARDAQFEHLVAERSLLATEGSDHTVRVSRRCPRTRHDLLLPVSSRGRCNRPPGSHPHPPPHPTRIAR
ncbi:MAG: PhoD-like phosphatase N-terminal domain-containing protein [Candidatus Synoicihabitans palmerolidicus]|nr:PhoD-like phosphatase N-terminal domain-containing protein [Candidatus Synoicihabitans palmerolidicus]